MCNRILVYSAKKPADVSPTDRCPVGHTQSCRFAVTYEVNQKLPALFGLSRQPLQRSQKTQARVAGKTILLNSVLGKVAKEFLCELESLSVCFGQEVHDSYKIVFCIQVWHVRILTHR
jgi:peroxiredoxin